MRLGGMTRGARPPCASSLQTLPINNVRVIYIFFILSFGSVIQSVGGFFTPSTPQHQIFSTNHLKK
jgi:hypothetical protein